MLISHEIADNTFVCLFDGKSVLSVKVFAAETKRKQLFQRVRLPFLRAFRQKNPESVRVAEFHHHLPAYAAGRTVLADGPVSYTHLTLPTN